MSPENSARRRLGRRMTSAILALGLAGFGANGCSKVGHGAPSPVRIPLVVRNHGFLDADIFAMQTASGPAIRLQTVIGGTTATIQVSQSALQPGGYLQLRVHAVGSSETWLSPSIVVDPDATAELDIYMDPNGVMRRSTLYAHNGGS